MENKDNQMKLGKGFVIKLVMVPIVLTSLFLAVASFLPGFSEMLKSNLGPIIIGFLFFEGFLMFISFTASGRFGDFFNNIRKKPLAITTGLFINLALIIYKKPGFLPDFRPFQEDLNIILIAAAGWIAFYVISLERIKRIISPVLTALIFVFSMMVTMSSIMFFVIIDVVSIFLWIFPRP